MVEEVYEEFSRPYNLDLIKKSGSNVAFEASENERSRLAARFNIVGVSALHADCNLRKMKQKEKGDYLLEVSFSAKIIQECILTLDEIEQDIEDNFSIIFKEVQDTKTDIDEHREVEFELEEEDIEYIDNRVVDIGEYVAEYLSLAINPYPRKANADASTLGHKIKNEDDVNKEPKRENPFNVLKNLKH